MSLTLTKLRSVITHRLGATLASQLDQDDIVNEAGRLLVALHQWKFLERPPASLDFTASTAYVALPSDFGQLIAYSYGDASGTFQFTDYRGLLAIRSQNLSTAGVTWGCIVQPTQAAVGSVPPAMRIELAPTPTSTISAALDILYRAKWTELTNTTDVPNTPVFVDALLRELVAAIALGYDEHDNGTLDERLERIQGGTLMRAAIQQDSMVQPDYGLNYGGAVDSIEPRGHLPFSSIADPT